MIVDADVLIWGSRGNVKAADILNDIAPFQIPAVVYMEVVGGMRNKQEFLQFQKALRTWEVAILHISESISQSAIFLVDRFALSHSLRPTDALVAATALNCAEILLTGNVRDFQFIPGLELERFRPE